MYIQVKYTIRFLGILILFLSSCGPKVNLDEYSRFSGEWKAIEISIKNRTYLAQSIPDTTLRMGLGQIQFVDCNPGETSNGCPVQHTLSNGNQITYSYVMSWSNDDREVILGWPNIDAPDDAGWQGTYRYDFSENVLTLTGISGSSEFAGKYNGQLLDIKLSR